MKPYSSTVDLAASKISTSPRTALGNYLQASSTSPVALRQLDNESRTTSQKYYGPDMSVEVNGQHSFFIEDEVRGPYWSHGEHFPSGGAHVPMRPNKFVGDLYCQIRFDGKALWIAPIDVIKSSPIETVDPHNNWRDGQESFYNVPQCDVDTYVVLPRPITIYPTSVDHHGYLEELLNPKETGSHVQ
jgi:hypothetical protein